MNFYILLRRIQTDRRYLLQKFYHQVSKHHWIYENPAISIHWRIKIQSSYGVYSWVSWRYGVACQASVLERLAALLSHGSELMMVRKYNVMLVGRETAPPTLRCLCVILHIFCIQWQYRNRARIYLNTCHW